MHRRSDVVRMERREVGPGMPHEIKENVHAERRLNRSAVTLQVRMQDLINQLCSNGRRGAGAHSLPKVGHKKVERLLNWNGGINIAR